MLAPDHQGLLVADLAPAFHQMLCLIMLSTPCRTGRVVACILPLLLKAMLMHACATPGQLERLWSNTGGAHLLLGSSA